MLEDKISEGKVSDPYKTIKEDIDKYELIEVKGKETGEYSEKDTEVTYVYRKLKGKVIAHYVDIYGNMIGYDRTSEGYIDDKYETTKRLFRGYELVQIVGDVNGLYTKEDIHVTYIYQKKSTSGEEKQDPVVVPINKPESGTGHKTTIITEAKDYSAIEIPNTGIQVEQKNYLLLFIILAVAIISGYTGIKLTEE